MQGLDKLACKVSSLTLNIIYTYYDRRNNGDVCCHEKHHFNEETVFIRGCHLKIVY